MRKEKITFCLPRVEITIPNVTRDLLILAPSFSLSPALPVELARSLENETKAGYKSEEHQVSAHG